MRPPLERLNNWLNYREEIKNCYNTAIYGTGPLWTSKRNKWNPLRYILGSRKVKALNPREFHMTFYGPEC